jgi:hypothetical protein
LSADFTDGLKKPSPARNSLGWDLFCRRKAHL